MELNNHQLAQRIGKNIKKLREKIGLSAQEFCEKAGITRIQSLYEYEKGLRIPKAKVLYNISTQFGLSIDSIFETEDYFQAVSTSEDIAKHIYEWEEELRESTSGVVGLRKVVLPFFSRVHRTEFSNIILEEQKGNPNIQEYVMDWRRRVELFESGGYVSKEICYMPTVMEYCQGKGKCRDIPLEERVSQLELIISRITDYKDNLEIRILERPAKISFVIYGKRLILNGETCFYVSKNPSLVRAFNQEFTLLWEDCLLKKPEDVTGFLGSLIKDLRTGRVTS